MTEPHQDDVEGAVERLDALCERAHDWPGDEAIAAHISVGEVKAMRALLTDWRQRGEEIERLQEQIAALQGPNTVHQNMLRGTIAKPSIEQIIHLYGEEAFQRFCQEGSAALTRATAVLEKKDG